MLFLFKNLKFFYLKIKVKCIWKRLQLEIAFDKFYMRIPCEIELKIMWMQTKRKIKKFLFERLTWFTRKIKKILPERLNQKLAKMSYFDIVWETLYWMWWITFFIVKIGFEIWKYPHVLPDGHAYIIIIIEHPPIIIEIIAGGGRGFS